MNDPKRIIEVSEITKIDEGTSYLQTRYDENTDGSKHVLNYGRVVVTEADGQTPKQGDLTKEDVIAFAKTRAGDEGIEVVYSEVATHSDNQDGSVPAPKA